MDDKKGMTNKIFFNKEMKTDVTINHDDLTVCVLDAIKEFFTGYFVSKN